MEPLRKKKSQFEKYPWRRANENDGLGTCNSYHGKARVYGNLDGLLVGICWHVETESLEGSGCALALGNMKLLDSVGATIACDPCGKIHGPIVDHIGSSD